jgi:hypothetical protein
MYFHLLSKRKVFASQSYLAKTLLAWRTAACAARCSGGVFTSAGFTPLGNGTCFLWRSLLPAKPAALSIE